MKFPKSTQTNTFLTGVKEVQISFAPALILNAILRYSSLFLERKNFPVVLPCIAQLLYRNLFKHFRHSLLLFMHEYIFSIKPNTVFLQLFDHILNKKVLKQYGEEKQKYWAVFSDGRVLVHFIVETYAHQMHF